MMPQLRDRLSLGVTLLGLSACAQVFGCAPANPSLAYLKGVQQTAIGGGFAQSRRLDVAGQCPTCTPDETIFAERIAGAEQGFDAGCNGMPIAEADYRQVKTMLTPDNSTAAYGTFVTARMCQVAEQYQACTAPAHRQLPAGDSAAPAGALTAAINQCHESNPAEAEEILDRAIAQESESINRSIQTADFERARPELPIYAALPRSNQQRAEQWRTTIANEESAEREASVRTAARVRSMVCDDNYYVQNPETGYANMIGGMNMRHGGRIGPDNPFEPVSKTDTKETRMAVLTVALSNIEELPLADAQELLTKAYALAATDKSYCGAETVTQVGAQPGAQPPE